VLKATGGNPEEVLSLLESPVGVDRGLRRRLSLLGPDAARLLSALAVLARPSEAGLVARVAGIGSLGRALGELIDAGLVEKTLRDGEVVLRPARHRFVDVAYEALTDTERQTYHARVVEVYRQARGLAAQDLAHHAIRAGDREAAVSASLEAATALEHSFAYEAAAGLLEDARSLASAGDTVELCRRLAALYAHTGSYEAALARAVEVQRALPDDLDALLTVGRLQALAGDFGAASRTLDRLESDVARRGGLPADELAAARAEIDFRLGDYERALATCDAALPLAAPAAAIALANTKGKVLLARGEYGAARDAFGGNLEAARGLDLARERAQALVNLGIVCLREHDHAGATARLEEALALARGIGALRESAIALENLAVLAHFRRDFGKALDCYHAAVSDLKKLGNRTMLARAANNLGELHLRLGDVARAETLAEFGKLVAGESAPRPLVAERSLLEGRVAARRGDSNAARRAFTTAAEIFTSIGERARAHEATLALARVDLERGDTTGARGVVERVLRGDALDDVLRGEAALLEAELERSSFGNPIRAYLVAADCFDRAADPDRGWRAHLGAALAYREAGDRPGAARHLGRAAELEAQVVETVPAAFLDALRAEPERARLRAACAELVEPAPASASVPPVMAGAVSPFVLEHGRGKPQNKVSPHRNVRDERFRGVVHRSAAMRQVLDLVERVAPTESIVLIRGESGTGKELVADAIHHLSRRRDKPFVKVNCAALVETLLLSELFGHEKGAFTGAMQRRKGRFEAADGGTLFLDEIGDVSPKTQVSLLRVLQEQQFERVGGTAPIRTDVRIVCATNRDLESLVRAGAFREDLYYRLKGIQITLPALRERPEDVAVLAEHFLATTGAELGSPPRALEPDALAMLERYGWPGNVRELENVIRSASLFADGPTIRGTQLAELTALTPVQAAPKPAEAAAQITLLPSRAAAPLAQPGPSPAPVEAICEQVLRGEKSLAEMKKDIEQRAIEAALDHTDGNITQAASLLGMKRPRLSQLVKEHGLIRREEKVQP
jgi:DNA-binding NtrC family response regulator/tetratricopeptide (TPR) repeat protein